MLKSISKVIIKKKLFGKPSVKIPERIFKKCKSLNSDDKTKIGFILEGENEVTFAVTPPPIDPWFARLSLYAERCDNVVIYKDVTGFFSYREHVFYRAKGSAGKSVTTNQTFTDFIKSKYPTEFENSKASDISKLKVTPLRVTQEWNH